MEKPLLPIGTLTDYGEICGVAYVEEGRLYFIVDEECNVSLVPEDCLDED